MRFAFIISVGLAVLAAYLDYRATRVDVPSSPLDDLEMRRATLERLATTRGNTTHRGERNRSADELLSSFDPTYFNNATLTESETTQ